MDAGDEPRFIPGTVLLDRYRIVALLGCGAMGEIYRANDLKLGEDVALKFLPESLANDGAMLARLYREVRIAHQISHPNVCRVYDISEVDGQHFISMEYIDGENLTSLLRRIGHPPRAKALEIAQQLCLGLSAAHARRVLHRDIKPANVMIDGRGQAKITDFGLAGLIEELGGGEIRAGTPAYMAPEQLHGLAVSIKSDIYSLGLVLFELFTGNKPFRNHQRGTAPRPSAFVDQLDPAIDRMLLRCLRLDPEDRPASVHEVAAGLPGGDLLAAAVAAGEIPSPEMVAAAPREGSLRPKAALACLGLLVAEILLLLPLFTKATLFHRLPLEKPPEVLADRARRLIFSLELGEVHDQAFGFLSDLSVARHFLDEKLAADRWSKLESGRAPVLFFWYRSSPRPMPPNAAGYWRVSMDDPPMTDPGMARVLLDPLGRLIAFRAVLPFREPPGQKGAPAKEMCRDEAVWSRLFSMAELDLSSFAPIEPQWVPPLHNDERCAWGGAFPDHPGEAVRVEAAAYRNRPVFFRVVAPWSRPPAAWTRPVPSDAGTGHLGVIWFQGLLVAVILTVLSAAVVLAWRHLLGGRGDRRGAFRLALFLFGISMVSWIFWASHVPTFAELMVFVQATAMALFRSFFIWIVYLALEPFVRQNWPERIISWSRFLSGRFRDPLVGRDVLIGAHLGLGMLFIQAFGAFLPTWFGQPMDPLDLAVMDTDAMVGLPGVLRQFQEHLFIGPIIAISVLFCLLLLTMLLGREKWAAAGCWLLLTSALTLGSGGGLPAGIAMALSTALLIYALQRFGLLAVAMSTVFYMTLRFFPLTTDPGAWYADITVLAVMIVVLPAVWGFYFSLAGQPLLGSAFLEDRISSSVSH